MAVVSQIDIQKRGGICNKIPSSCLVADLLSAAGLKASQLTVLDMTYGQGRFWAAAKPRLLIAADIEVYDWVVKPDIFIPKPSWQAWRLIRNLGISVDLVAVDPPWIRTGNTRRRHFGLDHALANTRMILDSALEAVEQLGARYMLVHYRERWVPKGYTVVVEVEWQPIARYVKNTTWWGLLSKSDR